MMMMFNRVACAANTHLQRQLLRTGTHRVPIAAMQLGGRRMFSTQGDNKKDVEKMLIDSLTRQSDLTQALSDKAVTDQFLGNKARF